ncbi:hypothetical protein DET57_11424 [Klebsiella oxytoca]|uniref:Morphogenetic protein n=1 Tax=Klebsiella oxytoca TaxID=571 RepID=A0A318FJW8_KLEOX|nr:hypothetical protein [Klebsiella oxytoca]PXW42032.1 hypothetical protein DET57_11424 [Klebsiella oxytoca]
MTERGMIFNGEMVRAILDGRKTQTRRIMKNQPAGEYPETPALVRSVGDGFQWYGHYGESCVFHCPYGAVGDRIWVRETWATLGNEDGCCVDWEENLCKGGERSAARIYRASCEQRPGDYGPWSIPDDAYWKPHTEYQKFEGAWRPSIHMPRWASRILLEITDVHVERLNSISESDARFEGVGSAIWFAAKGVPEDEWTSLSEHGAAQASHINRFATLWESIYGEESWKANPWVWVIEFKRIEESAA